MKYNRDLIGKHNTIDDIKDFCKRHEPLSLDALLLCDCEDPALLRRAIGLLKTGGVLALRGVDPSVGRSAHAKMLSAVFEERWQFYFCRDGDVIWTRICRREGSSEVTWTDPPLSYYMDLLKRGVPFSYLRYGDGEWNCALETICPGYGFQKFTPALCRDVQVSLVKYYKDHCYIMALAPIYHFRNRMGSWELIASFLRENSLNIEWVSTQPFNRASEMGKLWPFIQHLQQRDIIIVGPPRYKKLRSLFPEAAFVTIPGKHCHAKLAAIQEEVLAQKLPAIILITAGPACVVLIHRLFEEIGRHSTMIDIGSMWAPYIGQTEHGAHQRMTKEVMGRNVGWIE